VNTSFSPSVSINTSYTPRSGLSNENTGYGNARVVTISAGYVLNEDEALFEITSDIKLVKGSQVRLGPLSLN